MQLPPHVRMKVTRHILILTDLVILDLKGAFNPFFAVDYYYVYVVHSKTGKQTSY